MMALVDKELNPKRRINETSGEAFENNARSIFNLGDFRHNLRTEKMAREYDTKVSQKPRQFFDWDDGKRYDPKYKKDV